MDSKFKGVGVIVVLVYKSTGVLECRWRHIKGEGILKKKIIFFKNAPLNNFDIEDILFRFVLTFVTHRRMLPL